MENKGGMVYAKLGTGNYIYTSYSFFRQLPAGVPGAYRLFANLLSLPEAVPKKVNRFDNRSGLQNLYLSFIKFLN